MTKKVPVQFTLNGEEKAEFVEGGATLLSALRDKLGDTSPKVGCHQGTCGACSVIVDGELQLSCLTLAETCEGGSVQTTAGLATDGVLHPAAARLHRRLRRPMRLLYAGHDHGREGAARPQSRSRRGTTWSRRSPATSAAAPATSRSSMRCLLPPRQCAATRA